MGEADRVDSHFHDVILVWLGKKGRYDEEGSIVFRPTGKI
jgi:hypothetical protein